MFRPECRYCSWMMEDWPSVSTNLLQIWGAKKIMKMGGPGDGWFFYLRTLTALASNLATYSSIFPARVFSLCVRSLILAASSAISSKIPSARSEISESWRMRPHSELLVTVSNSVQQPLGSGLLLRCNGCTNLLMYGIIYNHRLACSISNPLGSYQKTLV